jgi:PAS domain S-box-containing protein
MEIERSLLLDALPGLIWTALSDGWADYVSKGWLDYTGLTFDEATGFGWTTALLPEDAPGLLTVWSDIVVSGRPGETEARLRRHDGEYRWFLFRACPMPESSAGVIRWCGMNFDIEQTKRAEAMLAAEKRLLEHVARGAPLPAFLEDLSRQVERLTPGSYCNVLLMEPGGERFQVVASPSLPDSCNAFHEGRAIDRDSDPCSCAAALKVTVIVADVAKDPRWAESSWPSMMAEHGLASCWSAPLLSTTGQVLGVFAIYWSKPAKQTTDEREIIDRFANIAGIAIERAQGDAALGASESELRRTNRYLTIAQRLSKTGSYAHDVLTDEQNLSEEMYRICEFDPAKVVTHEMVRGRIHPEDLATFDAAQAAAHEKGGDLDMSYRMVMPNGRVKHLHSVSHRQAEHRDRLVYVGATQDITERKLVEEALTRSRTELAHVARVAALSALTASIAHEVNQPLASLVTNASTCLRMLVADPPNLDIAQTTAQRTIRDANRASEVIQRLRAMFARKQPAREAVDLNEAAREVLALSASELQNAQVIVRADFADALPAVRGDRTQIQQVILNLVLNAADAMRAIDDRPRNLWIATASDGPGHVRLSVRDEGIGLDPESSEKLFDAFYTTKSEGMGVGLSISRSIIRGHDGRLWAASNEDGPGATFSFSIPCNGAGSTEQVSKEA